MIHERRRLQIHLPSGNFLHLKFTDNQGQPRYPKNVNEIIDQVVSYLQLKPSSRKYFGVYKKMSPNASIEWLEPSKPITPETITAAASMRLYFQLRFKPDFAELANNDFNATQLLHHQIQLMIRKNELPPVDLTVLLQLGTLAMVFFIIEDFHKNGLRCSRTDVSEVLPYVEENLGGFEQFLSQNLLDSYDVGTLKQHIGRILKGNWPLKEVTCLGRIAQLWKHIVGFGDETFEMQLGGNASHVRVTPDNLIIQDVMSATQSLDYALIDSVVVDKSINIRVAQINGDCYDLVSSGYAQTESFVSMVNGYCLIKAGRTVAHFEQAFVPFGANFGDQDLGTATRVLSKYLRIPGAFYLRNRAKEPGTFGLSVVDMRGQVKAYKIYPHSSSNSASGVKYGIEDGLRYETLDELMEHYMNESDGLCCQLTINVMALEFPDTYREEADGFGFDLPSLDNDGMPGGEYSTVDAAPSVSRRDLSSLEVPRSWLTQENELGSGEFGKVYAGTLNKPGERPIKVALKVLKQEDGLDEFMSEALVMAQMDHPNVVGLLGICIDTPKTLVTQLVPFGDLHNYLKEHRQNNDVMKVDRLNSFCVQIAAGMEHLSSRQLVHRDLAARNVLVADADTVRVSDFGLSKTLGNEDYYTAASRGKWPLKWYAPESIYKLKFHEKSDVWSYGVTCWEVYSKGKKPWSGKTGTQVIELINGGTRLEKPELCPPDIYNIMLKCWKYHPDDRKTFRELHSMVAQVCSASVPETAVILNESQYMSVQKAQNAFELGMPTPQPRQKLPLSRQVSERVAKSSMHIPFEALDLGMTIGSGSFGVVRKAGWKRSRADVIDVAVKCFTNQPDEGFKQLTQEVETLGKLSSPFIVQFYGISSAESYYLVTEFMALGALDFYLRKQAVSQSEMVSFLACIAEGMKFMSDHNIIHRDLCARNILVASPTLCKISDFGLARALNAGSDYYRSSNRGKWPIKWYAPECLYHSKFDQKSDVWSFGVTAWELFSKGQKPYKGLKGSEVLTMLENGGRLSKPKNTPIWAWASISSCWADDPVQRPSFAALCEVIATNQ